MHWVTWLFPGVRPESSKTGVADATSDSQTRDVGKKTQWYVALRLHVHLAGGLGREWVKL